MATKYDRRMEKVEARKKGIRIVVAPKECGDQGTPRFRAFYEQAQMDGPTIVMSYFDSKL